MVRWLDTLTTRVDWRTVFRNLSTLLQTMSSISDRGAAQLRSSVSLSASDNAECLVFAPDWSPVRPIWGGWRRGSGGPGAGPLRGHGTSGPLRSPATRPPWPSSLPTRASSRPAPPSSPARRFWLRTWPSTRCSRLPPPPHATLHHPHAPRDRRAPLEGRVNQGRRRTAADAHRWPAPGSPGPDALVALTTAAAAAAAPAWRGLTRHAMDVAGGGVGEECSPEQVPRSVGAWSAALGSGSP